MDSLEKRKHLERIEISDSILELMKIGQHKYSKDSKKINDRSGRVTRKTVAILEKKGVRILSFYDAL